IKEPDIKPARQDLWNFRWEHAQARIAARRGDQAEAQKHVAAAKAILDKGTIPEQAPFFPYLKGYVAFYAGDYKAALEELKQANQNDPFIQCMVGRAVGPAEHVDTWRSGANKGSDIRRDAVLHERFEPLVERVPGEVVLDVALLAQHLGAHVVRKRAHGLALAEDL